MTQAPRKIVVFTGAGLSADSGIQTFRGNDGLWENHSIEQVATFHTWKQNRSIVHGFYNRLRTRLPEAEPNDAHRLLADWQKRYGAVVMTQNVDDLLERAGCTDVIHVHGRLSDMRCTACGNVFDIGYDEWHDMEDRCPRCTSKKGVKPGVVFFGERAPYYPQMFKHLMALAEGDVLVVIGTSGKVVDIGSIAASTHATTILSNLASSNEPWMPGEPVVEDRQFDHVLHGRATERTPDLDALVTSLMKGA